MASNTAHPVQAKLSEALAELIEVARGKSGNTTPEIKVAVLCLTKLGLGPEDVPVLTAQLAEFHSFMICKLEGI